jgi:hypothetical protein
MKFMPGPFGHFPEWQPTDRRSDRVDLRPARPRRRRTR